MPGMRSLSLVYRFQLALLLLLTTDASVSPAADHRLISVPALSVGADHIGGGVQYIILQLDRNSGRPGPLVQFNEIHLGGGSAVGPGWKEGVRQAVRAAVRAVGIDGTDWLVTVKNRSYNAWTDGTSASSAVAVGLIALWRGESVRPDVALTGFVTEDGRIEPVGSVPAKIKVAARAGFSTVLVPRGQADEGGGDHGSGRGIAVIEVGTIEEAYRLMTVTP